MGIGCSSIIIGSSTDPKTVSGPLLTIPLAIGAGTLGTGGITVVVIGTEGRSSIKGLSMLLLVGFSCDEKELSGTVGMVTLIAVGLSERFAAGFSLTVHCQSGGVSSSASLLRLKN